MFLGARQKTDDAGSGPDLGGTHETEIYVRLQRVNVAFLIV